jgi:hypothetical protein
MWQHQPVCTLVVRLVEMGFLALQELGVPVLVAVVASFRES